MAYELKQELRLTQNLVMTPQLQLAIKLLQLSRLELVDMVRQEVLTNPVLEDTAENDGAAEGGAEEPPSEAPKAPEADWQAFLESPYQPGRLNFNERPGDDENDPLANVSSEEGPALDEYLLWQLNLNHGLTGDEVRLGEFIIGNIEPDGYLRLIDMAGMKDEEFEAAVVKEAARLTGFSTGQVEKVLSVIQGFDPPGVAARTLRECLLTQARLLPVRDTVAEEIISSHLELLARRSYKAIAKCLSISVSEVVDASQTINKRLNPTPGSGFGSADARPVVPDIYIQKVGDDYVISLNDNGLPRLRISRYYREVLKARGNGAKGAKAYLQDKMKSAMWLIKSVNQRQRTIYRVVECIVKFQREFLDNGLKYLRPLILRDVADEIEVHESTVSRVTSGKFVHTPRGIFELKYFFSNSMSNEDGSDTTAEYIKERLKGIIESEDSSKPLSDKRIVEILKESGIVLARRTATKYREAIGFQSSSRRRAHY